MITRNPDIAFTRNPIRINDNRTGIGSSSAFYLKAGGKLSYTGSYTAPAMIDISEIADCFVNPIPDPEDDHLTRSGVMIQIESADELESRLIEVENENDEDLVTPFFALPGGVSTQNFRRLKELNEDIFSVRLLDKHHNFFLTTRTNGWLIVMDEFEIFPLCFVNLKNETAKITITVADTAMNISDIDIHKGIFAIDFNEVRRQFIEEYGFLASAFDISYDGALSCRVVIKHTAPERDMTLVKFRNSFGVFELIHLSGKRERAVAPVGQEQDARRFDSISARYEKICPRKTLSRSMDAYSGFRSDEGMPFLLDMAASEEVYMKDRTGWVRVVPSIEQIAGRFPQLEPVSVKVKFTLADDYDCQTPDINNINDFKRPEIFSPQHTSEFN